MNQPNAAHHSHHALQYSRQPGLIQRNLDSPRTQAHHFQSTSQAPYPSPHSASNHSLPPQQYHSPYVGSGPAANHQHPGETTFYGAHPSPYSTHSNAPSYASSEPGESMTTHAAMSRQQYPPMSSYQTPQSNSPASMHSPQTDAHGRPLYQMPSMPQQMYYPPGYPMQQQSYPQHSSASYHASMPSAPPALVSYQHAQQQHQMQQPQHHPTPPQPGLIDTKPPLASIQRPPSVISPSQVTPQTPSGQVATPGSQTFPNSVSGPNASAAPGPIPATTPLVVRQDQNGVQWIAFEYSRDRVKMEYTIRCDVESVNTDELSPDFKSANCVYPRACCNKDQYKGNRLHYESECNAVGWALAQLNPPLREKRGLIQRAVDSWRNSNQDVRLRSRRVRRMAKIQTRKGGPQLGPDPAGSQPGLPGLPAGPNATSQSAPAPSDFGAAPAHHHQPPPKREEGVVATPSSTPRPAHNFYPTYAMPPNQGPGVMPQMHSPMHPPHSAMSATPASDEAPDEGRKRKLFGDVPESKRRKFILVDDGQRGTRVRVRVSLDRVKMDDMPDAHLKINSVYPRSYYPRQRTPDEPSRAVSTWEDEDDETAEVWTTLPTFTKTTVPVPLMDGSEAKMPVPRMTKSRRSKEVALNEIGYRMSWGQARAFNGRTLFLQRSLDAYRNKMRSTMMNAGRDVSKIAPHFETRIGKRRWVDRRQRHGRSVSP